jgi:hypothetical protein
MSYQAAFGAGSLWVSACSGEQGHVGGGMMKIARHVGGRWDRATGDFSDSGGRITVSCVPNDVKAGGM